MATRCRIGLMLEDGTIKHSYCHWDGYPEGVGETLVQHYSDLEKINELLTHGDMSFLAPNINPEGEHNFDNPEKGVTVFYSRDRGESGVDSAITTMEEYLSIKYSSAMDYLYVYKNGNWLVTRTLQKPKWKLVKSFLPAYSLTKGEVACNITM
jgi:hypothetical protein